MYSRNIENFLRDNPGRDFPWYETLTSVEATAFLAEVRTAIDTSPPSSGDMVTSGFQIFEPRVNAMATDFSLQQVIHQIPLTEPNEVYLYWLGAPETDRMRLCDVVRYWDDLWYPATDDTWIIEPCLRWVIWCDHDGWIRYWKAQRK
jgi:hypothetical protein